MTDRDNSPHYGRLRSGRRLKANPYAKGISVLGLSAHAMTPDRDKSIVARFYDCDTKSFDSNHLLCKVQELFGTPYNG